MRLLTTIIILLNSLFLLGQRTTFEDKLVVYVLLDSVEVELNEINVFTSEKTFSLEKIQQNLYKIPTNLSETVIDSFQFNMGENSIFIDGNLIKIFQKNGIIKLSFQNRYDYKCIESWRIINGCIGEVDGYDSDCKNKLKIHSYYGSCLLKLKGKIVEDCALKNERDMEQRIIQSGLPAQYENHQNGR